MPKIPTRSKLMRRPGVFSTPPICKSKSQAYGEICTAPCDDPDNETCEPYYDLDFDEFMEIVDELEGVVGSWTFTDPENGVDESGEIDTCGDLQGAAYFEVHNCDGTLREYFSVADITFAAAIQTAENILQAITYLRWFPSGGGSEQDSTIDTCNP